MNTTVDTDFALFTRNLKQLDNLISDKSTLLVLKILVYGVTPAICAIGVLGNILSIVILYRHGLHKSSNILLVSLAFADLCFLISFNNVPKALYDIEGDGYFMYSRSVSFCLYMVYFFLTTFDYGMAFLGLTIPALITVERFIAVFFPLKMTSIVTPFRTWAVVIFFGLYGMGFMIYSCFWSQFVYTFDQKQNRSVGLIAKSDLFYKDREFRQIMDQIHIGVKIQPLVTLGGCVLIIIKVKMASIKRKKLSMSSQQQSVSRTTQTLIAVCTVYLITCTVLALPSLLPESILHFNLTADLSTLFSQIMYQVMNIVLCLNSSWNFVIYIVFNKNFRDTYREIVTKPLCLATLSSRK